MKILIYRGLDIAAIPGFDKLAGYLRTGDFRSAQIKKVGDNLYRARLDRSNRLLFALDRHAGEPCLLALEFIHQHAYAQSRFLARGVTIDEGRIPPIGAEAAETGPWSSFRPLEVEAYGESRAGSALHFSLPYWGMAGEGNGQGARHFHRSGWRERHGR
ncbi:hypothetical protein [uncultured Thiodictyon sp.]|uniref:hypothetical protein n=1 Tax=uncultured Thiodictyon sp. TaxID=1846217 RepID=UPI0025FC7639|nr:hypothetical protein [uncultured Thiodictyon sp.]